MAQIAEEEEEVLFVDTLELNQSIAESLEDENLETDDSLQVEAQLDMDSLARQAFIHYIPKTPLPLLADRLNCIEKTIPLTANKRVAGFIDYFVVRNRNYTQTMLERKDFYFPIFEKYLKEFGLPDELKYLSIVESGLNHSAISRSSAVGLWQFMSFTGKDMKLHQDFYIDQRMDPEASTIAACRYLKMLYNVFHDWHLVLASYNCGLGKVLKVMKRTGKNNFWDLYESLPMETRAYVPQFIAVTYSMNYASAHNIHPDQDSLFVVPLSDTMWVNGCLDLTKLASLLEVDHKIIKVLNPELRRAATPHNREYIVRVPADKKAITIEKRQAILDSCYIPYEQAALAYERPYHQKLAQSKKKSTSEVQPRTKVLHRVRKGENLQVIAQLYQVKVNQLKKWNKRLVRRSLKAGQTLIVFSNTTTEKSLPTASNTYTLTNKNNSSISSDTFSKVALGSEPVLPTSSEKRIVYQVRAGDTLYKIMRKFNATSISQLMKLNDLKEQKITVGQKLIIG
ncbi:MAG: Membrane-bound lytic murein transglycosylase D [candidate division WS2 bacterium]|uniref:Membrane-bound lytic murein transglycosylase D n=1 Tax=Psychracetigena formicireducens TaxID=2986056 RepID=A0A9E2BJB5_PSYF1|nr:Membrane-bound lytic murein transglycosylase D [Candidatus Psychracetigena formicireducens]